MARAHWVLEVEVPAREGLVDLTLGAAADSEGAVSAFLCHQVRVAAWVRPLMAVRWCRMDVGFVAPAAVAVGEGHGGQRAVLVLDEVVKVLGVGGAAGGAGDAEVMQVMQ